ncbi:hypothetical protein V6N13_083748 [Hibiscus sabdariffa]
MEAWPPKFLIDSCPVWLSICMHAWFMDSFVHVAMIWNEFVRIDLATKESSSFGIYRVLIETKKFERINEVLDFVVVGKNFMIQVQEVELVRTQIVKGRSEGEVSSFDSDSKTSSVYRD